MVPHEIRNGSSISKIVLFYFFAAIFLMPFEQIQAAENVRHEKVIKAEEIQRNIYSSAILKEGTYILVGDRGMILRSQDRGSTWNEISTESIVPLFSVTFSGSQKGWISGLNGLILHSGDRGLNWSKQQTNCEKHLFAIDFLNDQIGCAVGDWGTILVTQDGGHTWEDVSLPDDIILYDIKFSDEREGQGWIVGEMGHIFKTLDYGSTWEEVSTTQPLGATLFCLDVKESLIYCAGLEGKVVFSKDGGQNWEYGMSASEEPIYDLACSEDVCLAVGAAGMFQIKNGLHWKIEESPERYKLFWIADLSMQANDRLKYDGFGVGADGLFFEVEDNLPLWGK